MRSPTLVIHEKTQALRRAGKTVFQLGFGQSPFPVPPEVVAALQAHAHEKAYLPVQGLPALREAIALHEGAGVKADQVLIGPGSKELIFLVQMVLEASLLLPAPSWVSYAPQAQLLNRAVHWLPTRVEEDWKLQPAVLANAATKVQGPKLLILNSPNNPCGHVYTAGELQALAEVARQHGLYVLSDEIYRRLSWPELASSFRAVYPEKTLVTSSLSKWCGAGGWRLGYLIVPQDLASQLERMNEIASETYSCVSAPIQYAAVAAYGETPSLQRYLRHSQNILACITEYTREQFMAMGLVCPGGQGAYYLFPSFEPLRPQLAQQQVHSGPQLAEYLLREAGIASLPGQVFGRPEAELTLRFCLVDFAGESLLDFLREGGVCRSETASVAAHFPNIFQALRRLKAALPLVNAPT